MRFGIFYEHQLPRPWSEGDELKLFQDALDQVELADGLGIDYAWEVEHHFLEEYSHSSAPEVFLAACSQRTKAIRLGHGIVLMPPGYNHPARVAERIATLDLVSNGRVEWGTGESSAALELEGYGVPVDEKREQWREAVEQCANMLAMDPYPGFEGQYFSMPCRNVVPKPVQRPHPPLWVACSNRETIKLAARLGIGALTFAFVDPEDARQWTADYYRIFKEECVPIGHAVNPNIAMVTGFSVHQDAAEAKRRGMDGYRFFNYALGHHYGFGLHKPGRTDIWSAFEKARPMMPEEGGNRGIGDLDQLRAHLKGFHDAGVDQVAFIQQGGRNRHEDICEALELFASDVMPQFKEKEDERLKRKAEELAPYVEAAMKRKKAMPPLRDEEIPEVKALGRRVAEQGGAQPLAATSDGKTFADEVRRIIGATSGG
jgi:alkanesulfonate monooxygenase SsuD/methylene tetrahydromethanopterin reductase-like flavin-dependent oxidoreductase (luciferase family)